MRKILIIVGGILSAVWGMAHLFPTSSVVAGFGSISQDNIHIITMEWINEGLSLIFIGILTITVAVVDYCSKTARAVYLITTGMLIAMAILSLFTGFNVNFLPFKLCPFIFTISGALIVQGVFIKNKND